MNIEINHVLVRTRDLKKMIWFLTKTVGLKEGFRPQFGFPGAWLYSNDKPLVHLVEVELRDQAQSDYLGDQTSAAEFGAGVVDHIAFSGSDYLELIEHLKQHQVDYFERTVPLTEEHQVFAEGPEGLRIEILFEAEKVRLASH